MKLHISTLIITCFFIAIAPTNTMAITIEKQSVAASQNRLRATILIKRLHTIQQMNTSNTTKLEKNALRKEVLSTQKELKELSGGVYLSVGVIIIILLLLIVLL